MKPKDVPEAAVRAVFAALDPERELYTQDDDEISEVRTALAAAAPFLQMTPAAETVVDDGPIICEHDTAAAECGACRPAYERLCVLDLRAAHLTADERDEHTRLELKFCLR